MYRFQAGLIACLFGFILLVMPSLALMAEESETKKIDQLSNNSISLTYSFGALVKVVAAENAASTMYLGLWAPLQVHSDGRVFGEGVISYEQINPCAWRPPHPENGGAPYCRIDKLHDGRFKVTGEVVEWVHRHDEDNKLKNMIFAYADSLSKTRLGYAPLKLRLKVSMISKPQEALSFWGFSTPTIEERKTGAGELGLHASNLLERAFEIAPIPTDTAITGGADLKGAHQFMFSGNYKGGTPLSGNGSAFFLNSSADKLPASTDTRIYHVHEDKSPKPRTFSDDEMKAIEDYKKNGYQAPSRFHEDEMAEQIINILNGL